MGTAFLYGNGCSGGTGATLTVTAPAGCTVTISRDGKAKTKTAGADGLAVFKGLSSGDWLLSITDGTQTAQKTVTITADYTTAITFFAATIHVTYPAGSTCTATDGVTTLTAPDTSGTWDCVVPNNGDWVVSLDNGFSEVVSITEDGQIETINKWYLYKSGNEYTKATGGWSEGVRTVGDGLGTVTKKNDTVYFHIPDIIHDDCPLATLNKVDLSKFKTLCAEYERISCTNSSYFYLFASYLDIRGLHGSSGTSRQEIYNGGSNQIVAADISNVGAPNYVTVGIYASDPSEVNTAYLKSVWAM